MQRRRFERVVDAAHGGSENADARCERCIAHSLADRHRADRHTERHRADRYTERSRHCDTESDGDADRGCDGHTDRSSDGYSDCRGDGHTDFTSDEQPAPNAHAKRGADTVPESDALSVARVRSEQHHRVRIRSRLRYGVERYVRRQHELRARAGFEILHASLR